MNQAINKLKNTYTSMGFSIDNFKIVENESISGKSLDRFHRIELDTTSPCGGKSFDIYIVSNNQLFNEIGIPFTKKELINHLIDDGILLSNRNTV